MTQKDDWQSQEARLEAYLQRLDVGALRKLILEASWRDDALRQKLLMAATVAESTGLSDLRKVVKQATRTNGFIEYREAGAYANRLEDLGELLSQRIADGEEELIEVIEEAIALAEEALQHIDDSGGEVMPAVVELRRVHLAACNALHPDPVALAERLYGFQMNGQWDTFHEVLPGYAEALGERALDFLWQKVAEEEAADSGVRRRPRDKPRRVDIVSIFLRDGDAVAMWDAFISEATCSSVACSSKRNGRPGRPLVLRICCQRFWKSYEYIVQKQARKIRRNSSPRSPSSPACRGRWRRSPGDGCGSRCSRRVPTRRYRAARCRRWSAGCRRRPC